LPFTTQKLPAETFITSKFRRRISDIKKDLFRVTKDEKTILDLTAKLVTAFSEAQRFRATEAVLVTYEDMAADNSDGLNLFQVHNA
jgi:hypothetical protein